MWTGRKCKKDGGGRGPMRNGVAGSHTGGDGTDGRIAWGRLIWEGGFSRK